MSEALDSPPVTAPVTPAGSSRTYNKWTRNSTLEDYSLRYAPRSFRKWTPYVVATTALGGIAYLADFAIGGSIAITHGFASAVTAILVAALVIFLTGVPISYYSAKYAIDMDLLTRGAGFGYLGSTLTSLIYASFTFIFFALEGSIMAQAFELGLHIPLAAGYLIASLVIIPLVIFGMTALSKLQVWTQPIWLVLMFAPFVSIAFIDPGKYAEWTSFAGNSTTGSSISLLGVGLGAGVALSLIAQIGEQVDYLRFMPDRTPENSKRWWTAVLAAGPGWVILGAFKQLGGAFLAFYVASDVGLVKAGEPIEQFLAGFKTFMPPWLALTIATFFVILSQVKINVTNAYSGSLSWSNFFSRLLHKHPGRVVWIFLNVGVSLALMEFGVFGFLNSVLGFYSNVAIAWIGAVTADLVINKPLKLSPSYIEFKRAHLYNFNPVGFGSMLVASVVSIMAFFGLFGETAQAFSPFIALVLAFVLSPITALVTKGKYYIARTDDQEEPLFVDGALSGKESECTVCAETFERPDIVGCPFHSGAVCSLCCSLESDCHDACKKPVDLGMPAVAH
ncbi:purine-cytosine permease family protein [Amycolatopsis alkalitolerans]|uniref:Allantoin permease n=1 Tax=Amycolatopsis alkalitolerans TaxID=2547244 RepID=A0A5C4LT56_9PSEU|nr:hypothetical protein [Amycolatopsis alkalitolerans]TNC22207.1 hypothetical protein FG385_25855 [Amycolatopsis alkalitolerans]